MAITIQLVTTWNTNDIVRLYKAANWWKESYDAKHLPRLIQNSFAFVVAVDTDKGKTIGMGRVISDAVSDAYIQDVVVLDDYRKQGIGTMIIDNLVSYCTSKGIHWIGLIAEPGSAQFYKNSGFHVMVEYIPMLYSKDEKP